MTAIATDTTTIANVSKLDKGLIRKQSSVYVDIKCKRFISTETFIRTKNKNKNKELGHEIIKLDVYKYKCGFTTNRPLAWAQMLENYVDSGSPRSMSARIHPNE